MSTEYPKIETVFDRDESFNVIENKLRLPEFNIIKTWQVTEKVDGTNIRILYEKDCPNVEFYGRTDNAQIPSFLLKYLQQTFVASKLNDVFANLNQFQLVVLYGEGYGAKIQKGGGNYRPKDVSFRLFDVKIGGLWLTLESVQDIATKLGIKTVPYLGEYTLDNIVTLVKSEPISIVAKEDSDNLNHIMEGVIARTNPLLLRRNGSRLMWKLKVSDYKHAKSGIIK
jgi:ATP-dependent RNA circularization protein (DNA/RNA ligase family)